jgi:hypothetical protein
MMGRLTRLRAREVPLERLSIERMANGWSCILLTERIGYDEFPAYAKAIASMLGGSLGPPVDAPDIRMRSLRQGLRWYWIVLDDFPLGVTIEPRSRRASRRVQQLHDTLVTHAP